MFTQYYGTDSLDASLLLMPLVRFLPSNDHRVRATVLAIADELTEDGLVLRYRIDETDDGLSGEEGTFTICSFWLVSALVEIGDLERARHLCERLLGFASPLELYAEEIDTRPAGHLGNFPQAFTHLAQINAVMHVIRAEESERAGTFQPAHSATRTGAYFFGLSEAASDDSAATKASCGTSTRPIVFIRFLPSFCFSSSLRLRLMSPP